MLINLCSKSFKLCFSCTWTKNLQMCKLGLKGQRNQRSNCQHLLDHRESKGIPENYLLLTSLIMLKPLTVWFTTNCGKFLKRWEYLSPEKPVSQEATVRTGHGTTDWFKIRKGVWQGCILSPCLFNSYAEYIIQNTRLDEPQIGIMIAGRNINNLSYADNTTLMPESEEELKSLLISVKEESEKAGLKLSIQKTRIMPLHGK